MQQASVLDPITFVDGEPTAYIDKDCNIVQRKLRVVPEEQLIKAGILKEETNPKDLVGSKKISTYVMPAVAQLHASHAMMDGAEKYGPYNWREKKIQASVYLDATERHLLSWREREESASDSGVHHLGHAIACLAILLDAQETGNLIDDRPHNGEGTLKLIARLNATIKHRREANGNG